VRQKSLVASMRIFFPPGSGGDLHVTPIYEDVFGNELNLIAIGDVDSDDPGDDYLSGDSLARDYTPNFETQEDGYLVVEYENNDAVNEHWFELVFELQELM